MLEICIINTFSILNTFSVRTVLKSVHIHISHVSIYTYLLHVSVIIFRKPTFNYFADYSDQ
jgi:hypothetical protein